MGEDEELDSISKDCFEENGFEVKYEDSGCRRTIFDDFYTLEHFRRVEFFKQIFSEFENFDADRASDFAHSLEELHPKLFDAFASAARAFKEAETSEDCAQVAISGRRLLEQIANYLFPPQDETWNGRNVGNAEYKNRLWAYLEQTISKLEGEDDEEIKNLGDEADRLVDRFNSGLHAHSSKEQLERDLADLVIWMSNVINLSPENACKPYLAYKDAVTNFVKKL